MIVCQCAVVSDRVVTEAVATGARSLAQVCRATGAGRDCGACVLSVKRVITEHRQAASCGVAGHHAGGGEIRRRQGGLLATSA